MNTSKNAGERNSLEDVLETILSPDTLEFVQQIQIEVNKNVEPGCRVIISPEDIHIRIFTRISTKKLIGWMSGVAGTLWVLSQILKFLLTNAIGP